MAFKTEPTENSLAQCKKTQPTYNSAAMPISHQGNGLYQAVIQLGHLRFLAPTLHHCSHPSAYSGTTHQAAGLWHIWLPCVCVCGCGVFGRVQTRTLQRAGPRARISSLMAVFWNRRDSVIPLQVDQQVIMKASFLIKLCQMVASQ